MSSTDSYIIFEADQVLTNDHLNEMFDYLDTQERLTRNKLIGIGIVCGLEIDNRETTISISKGCGVTSKGYLVVWQEAQLTQYIEYTLPAVPLYTPFINESNGKQYKLLRMLTDEEADKIDAEKKPIGSVLKDKVVVLFLEANEKDLKNCDTQDCNEKGRQMDLTVRALLIDKADMEAIIQKQKRLSGDEGLSNSYIERLGLKDIPFKRFDVKATPLQDAYDIYDSYLDCFNNEVLKNVANAYSQCYSIFHPLLPGYNNNNPFKNLEAELSSKLNLIKKSMPIYIQYYYDFIDDLIKAYLEFRERSFEVITECCPDEDLFPMHLMLGEATVDTMEEVRSPFRQYFIYSPLFNNQSNLQNEVKLLFDRMVTLVKSFFIPTFNSRNGVPIRITPSRWGLAPLSTRSIPYYYNISYVSKVWDPLKSRKGRTNYNLSYNADKYSPQPPDSVINPLLYVIEPFDFYRIEGHIGQQFSSVLNVILSIRNSHRLPFDVIALKAGTDAADTAVKYDCHFEDLEAQFALLRAELACKMHEPLCIAAKVPSLLRFNVNNENTNFSFLNTLTTVHTLALQDIVDNKNRIITNFVQITRFTKKGDFLKTYCPVTKGTLAAEYIDLTNKFVPRPAKVDLTTSSGSKAALMHLIDITEALMQSITGASTIFNFKYDYFNRIYVGLISFFTEFMQALLQADNQKGSLSPLLYGNLEAVVTGCMDEKIKALTLEYTRRVEKIQKQNLLSEYLSSNPGIDHKAGVPRGGTFIIVYHDAPAANANITATTITLTNLSALNTDTAIRTNTASLAETTAISKNNLSKILKLFDTTDLQLSNDQVSALKNLTLQNFSVAAAKKPFNIPDNAVVADFYLPYLCCSDCPPVAYVLPKTQPDILLLSLDKTDFCNNDGNAYKITVNPVGGTLTASAGGLDADKMEFRPKGLNAGINKITYKLPDERSTSIDVKITEAFEIDFKFEPTQENPFTIRFIPSDTENKVVSWNFGDGTALSAEQSPVHTFTLTSDPQTFVVALIATDGPCIIETKHEIRLTKPRQQVFSIQPTVFCFNDRKAYPFNIDPAVDDIAAIKNPDGLTIERNTDGNIVMIPAKQNLQQNKDYQLELNGVQVSLKIIAITNLSFKADPVDGDLFARKFVTQTNENRKYEWNFGDGTPLSNEPSPTHVYQFGEETRTFVVTLTVNEGPCKATVEQNITISRPQEDVFAVSPTTFCRSDKNKRNINVKPVPSNLSEIRNPGKLLIEQDAANGQIFFIPAKQDIAQTKAFSLSYSGIDIKVTIFVAVANFTMKLERNPSPIAVFPTMLTLNATEPNADNYLWKVSAANGPTVEFKTRQVVVNLAQLGVQDGIQLTIFLTVDFNRQAEGGCSDTKDYVITRTIFANHLNKGEFDNSTSS